ncbi:tyrosine-type recombinase/integrase [Pseudomonas sp. NCHU5208]|uniref:tyrosine-type recombinase/integrase n=1 Tax=unclassified Pseudomonas TaxID=196821 RepID=UPI003F966B3F
MKTIAIQPRPLFGKIVSDGSAADEEHIGAVVAAYLESFPREIDVSGDHAIASEFVKRYSHNASTLRTYRTFVERLLLWSWIIRGRSILDLSLQDAEDFVRFNKTPASEWIGPTTNRRFVLDGGAMTFNSAWRPFSEQRSGAAGVYTVQRTTLELIISTCHAFYEHVADMGHEVRNPFSIKQRSRLTGQKPQQRSSKSLTQLEWDYLLDVAREMADSDPKYERSLFIVVALFSMYLRIGDLAGSDAWQPTMGSFFKRKNCWWFAACGKGGVQAEISVKPDFLEYLKRYRESRNLTPLPASGENTPLLTTNSGRPGLSARQIRSLVQEVFDRAIQKMLSEGRTQDECDQLKSATVHWLRHTGATFDAEFRPVKHLQMDLRHASLQTTTDIYYNSIDEERAASNSGLGIRRG